MPGSSHGSGLLKKTGDATHEPSSPSDKSNVVARLAHGAAKQLNSTSVLNVDYYKHTVKKSDTLHGIAAYYFCGYGNLWDHIFSTAVHQGGVGKVGTATTFTALVDADSIKVGEILAIPIMQDTRKPLPDGMPSMKAVNGACCDTKTDCKGTTF